LEISGAAPGGRRGRHAAFGARRVAPGRRRARLPPSGSALAEGVVKLFYSPEYVRGAHAFETTRKARWIADSLRRDPLPGIEIIAPAPLTEAMVCEVHDAAYVQAVRTGRPRALAESQGFPWDASLWPMVCASNGGAVAAALAALTEGVAGSLSSGLHHARRDRGAGFCTFNGLALAVRAARAAGAREILILDLDAHCGGGTHSLLAADACVWQIDVAVSPFDRYEPSARASLDVVRDAARYLPVIEARLKEVEAEGPRFDLCLYNAGMDPFEGCSVGGLHWITRAVLDQRERLVFDWCRRRQIPVAFVIAGGYLGPGLDEPGLVALHRLTLCAAAGVRPT
jgi:acetoin utilization deacetylase AcuC-like enzyme